MTDTPSRRTKVGLVGTGMVGASFAYALMQRSVANELVLIDANRGRAEAEAQDLNHGLSFVRPMRIWAGDYPDLEGAAVTVVTAGAAQKEGETRLQLLERNAGIFRQIIPQIVQHNPSGVILIASNPVDIMTYLSLQMSGLPPKQVIGSGTILDTARFRTLLGEHYTVDPRSVHASIVGEHGDSEVPLWSLANRVYGCVIFNRPRVRATTRRPYSASSKTRATLPTASSSAKVQPTTPSAWACSPS